MKCKLKLTLVFALCCFQACAEARKLDAIPEGSSSSSTSFLAADSNVSNGTKLYTASGSFSDPTAKLVETVFTDGNASTSDFLLSDSSDVILRANFGKLFVINRGTSSIQVVNLSTHAQEADYSVGAGSNPQDMVLASLDKAYVSRLNPEHDPVNQDDLLVLNPLTGEKISSLDLKPYTDATGDHLARAAQMVLVNEKLYVLVQDLSADFSAKFPGKLVVVNTANDEVENIIPLVGYNPFDITYSPVHKKIYVSDSGAFLPDYSIQAGSSGIEVIDPESSNNEGLLLSDVDFGGSVGELRIANSTEAYVLVYSTVVAKFDPSTMHISNPTLFTSSSFYVPDFTVDASGDIWLAENTIEHPAVLHLNTSDGSTKETIELGSNTLSLIFAGE